MQLTISYPGDSHPTIFCIPDGQVDTVVRQVLEDNPTLKTAVQKVLGQTL